MLQIPLAAIAALTLSQRRKYSVPKAGPDGTVGSAFSDTEPNSATKSVFKFCEIILEPGSEEMDYVSSYCMLAIKCEWNLFIADYFDMCVTLLDHPYSYQRI